MMEEFYEWETVQVCPVPPGWRHVYLMDGEQVLHDIPVVLLQEHRKTNTRVVSPDGVVRYREEEEDPPFETRVIFGTPDEFNEVGDDAMMASNFVGVAGPGADLSHSSWWELP